MVDVSPRELATPVPDVQEETFEPIPEIETVDDATIVADDTTATLSLWKPKHFDLDSWREHTQNFGSGK
jgi:hypothetical protein